MKLLNQPDEDYFLSLYDRYLAAAAAAAKQATTPIDVASAAPRAWYVVQTKSGNPRVPPTNQPRAALRSEDRMAAALREIGFASYIPTMRIEVVHHRTRRRVMREFKVFNRYVFAELPTDFEEWRTVRAIDEFHRVLGANGVPCPIAEAELAEFRRAEAARQFDVTKTELFPVGSRVRIKAGPLAGFAGLVKSFPGREKVRAMVDLLGRLTPVDVPFDGVEPE